jgi:hypothetical protein
VVLAAAVNKEYTASLLVAMEVLEALEELAAS